LAVRPRASQALTSASLMLLFFPDRILGLQDKDESAPHPAPPWALPDACRSWSLAYRASRRRKLSAATFEAVLCELTYYSASERTMRASRTSPDWASNGDHDGGGAARNRHHSTRASRVKRPASVSTLVQTSEAASSSRNKSNTTLL
jgi:hypothetical protein